MQNGIRELLGKDLLCRILLHQFIPVVNFVPGLYAQIQRVLREFRKRLYILIPHGKKRLPHGIKGILVAERRCLIRSRAEQKIAAVQFSEELNALSRGKTVP